MKRRRVSDKLRCREQHTSNPFECINRTYRSGRYGTSESIAWAHTFWCVFWLVCRGRRQPPATARPDSAMKRGKCLKSSRRSLWSMWCCPRAVVWSYASAVSVNRPSTNGFCCNISVCGCPQRQNGHKCSGNFLVPTLIPKTLFTHLRKLG